jgi:glycosyltransferase involved in cell wall biosynthesis
MLTRPAEPLQVLHLLGTSSPGGVETFVMTLARFMDPERCRLHVCITDGPGPVASELRELGVQVVLLGRERRAQLWHIVQHARRHRFDLLHANLGGRALRYAVRATQRCPALLHLHAQPRGLHVNSPAAGPSLSRVVRGVSSIAVCSQWLATWTRQVLPSLATPVQVVYYGIEHARYGDAAAAEGHRLRAMSGIPSGAPVFGFVGRLVAQKGIPHLVETSRRVLTARREAHLLVAGGGPLRPEVQALEGEFSGRVHLLHAAAAIPAVMRTMDVLVLPSAWEPLGIVALEAMAAARPVVAFGVGGIPEVVIDGQTGLLSAPADAAALSVQVLRVLDDPALRERLGNAGRLRVQQRFDGADMARRIAGLYENVLRTRR